MVKESTIREMTRLAQEYKAVNLSQGFPNESPPESMRLALAYTALTGQVPKANDIISKEYIMEVLSLEKLTASSDTTNQYSPPMGRDDIRNAVKSYYHRLYGYDDIDADDITITLGATEAMATALRTVGAPGDKVVIFEPFHELYPNQCELFYLEPSYVTLKEVEGSWQYDAQELRKEISEACVVLINSPHNPTGKVFSKAELLQIVEWCLEFDVYIITDEIYEHMVHPNTNENGKLEHFLIPQLFPQARDRVLVCNSIGKSASATGWRVGWCITPPLFTGKYRSIHDQMVVMSPHPMQIATVTYLNLPNEYFQSELPRRYLGRVDKLRDALLEVGFEVSRPHGAYYIFADFRNVLKLKDMDPREAAMYMIKTIGVACVPGDNFYAKDMHDGNRYIRFAACRSQSDIDSACQLITKNLKL